MNFIVDNLQQYFMSDVLEAQFSILLKKMEASKNFEELRHAHDIFLAEVSNQTFVNHKQVCTEIPVIKEILIRKKNLVSYKYFPQLFSGFMANFPKLGICYFSNDPLAQQWFSIFF